MDNGETYRIDIATGNLLVHFSGGALNGLYGLAVFGELTQALNADLVITNTDSPDPVVASGTLTYTLTVKNNGPSAAGGVTVKDTLPSGVTFVSATSSQGTCTQAAGTVTCAIGTMAVNGTANVQIRIKPTVAGSLSNTARVSSNISDPNAANNSATAITTVTAAGALV